MVIVSLRCRPLRLNSPLWDHSSMNLLTFRMLRPTYFCRLYKDFLSCSLQSGMIKLGTWPKNMHRTTERYSECETEEQTCKYGAQQLSQNQDEDSKAVVQLHIPVMVNEVVRCLAPQKGQIFLDMTFGSGGHTRAMLHKESDITLYALDRDPTAYAIAEKLSELYPYPDMPTAADVVNALDQQALASILRTYGEEKHAKKIASAIVQARSIYPITRTQQLASIVAGAFPTSATYARRDLLQRSTHIATKTFQALRIFVNNELNELYTGLKTAQKCLRPGGRLVALSFHSLEDRIVKRFLLGINMTERFNLSVRQKVSRISRLDSAQKSEERVSTRDPLMWELIHKKVLIPEDKDVQDNPRGRSAKLRAAIKLCKL
ncbi:12S rRNA N4-methylcytidine (m4C) methyltransferase isoform X3 [Echinops telfairi]|uniref:12S rRNA N4-methylcytidine (M4C) methyltransferase isoform X3 n=1 Tax=Echinops telfairi TaxID=9371 RepID=A0AC55D5I2_ECHTE|nr:12S rRNA N4-methylcytidine (m4C) methyltransferase isoform X3 [Echinops telfairi]